MRRSHLSLAFVATALLVAGCVEGGDDVSGAQTLASHSVAAGDVTSTSVVLLARAPRIGVVSFQVATDEAFGHVVAASLAVVINVMVPAKTQILGLVPGTVYHYRARSDDQFSTPGTFKTPALPGTHAGLHFAVAGDWRQDMRPYPALRNAPAMDLDFAVALGDTIYADVASPAVPVAQAATLAEFRAKHAEAYSPATGLETLGDLRDSTAIFATIDDHEVMDDFAGGAAASTDPRFGTANGSINDTALFQNGIQAFLDWNPIADEIYTSGIGFVDHKKLYRFRTFGSDAAVFVLDQRSFRSQKLPQPTVTDSAEVEAWMLASFDPSRTMLGAPQLLDLQADLLAAQTAGMTWKFIMIPEPIQNLGPAAGSDRYEGYSYERSRLLSFLRDNGITNVVFITADIHGTIVNNLQYKATGPDDPEIDVDAFEISVPAVAYGPPLGQDAVIGSGLFIDHVIYDLLPSDQQDSVFASALDSYLDSYDYSQTGLEDSTLDFDRTDGQWVRANEFGWGEFQIDPITQVLTVTIWGIEPYTPSGSASAATHDPNVLLRFTVTPK